MVSQESVIILISSNVYGALFCCRCGVYGISAYWFCISTMASDWLGVLSIFGTGIHGVCAEKSFYHREI